MFDLKLVMRHVDNNNPYRIKKDNGKLCTRKETIILFNKLGLTDLQLCELNEYIRKDRKHNTFYNWCTMVGIDCSIDILENTKQNNIEQTFTVGYENENKNFEVKIENFVEHIGYIEFVIICDDIRIRSILGETNEEIWVCFPDLNKGCSIKEATDVEHNIDKFIKVFKNDYYGIIIACAIDNLNDKIISEDRYYEPYSINDVVLF